jgi:8-oxo-dGTP pyrophosphatase MutT (NUDIX family)
MNYSFDKEAAPNGVERLPSGGIKYRGTTFPGYNKPRASTRPQKKKMVLAKKGDQVKVIHFGQKGYKHNYSAKAKKSYLARSAGIKGKDDKFSANYWARRVLWPSGQKADGSEKKAAQDIHINKPSRSKKELSRQLHMLQKVIANSSSKDLEYAKYIAEAHANTPKEVAKLVAKLNPEKPDWKIDPELDGAFIRDVLNKKNKTKYYLRRPHLLEEDLGIPLGLKSDMARSTTSPSYPSYHSAVASYLTEHAKKDVPEESRHKLDELARRIQKTRQILGYHTIQDTDEGGRIGRDYALSQLKNKKEKTASQALYRPRGTIFLTDGKGNVLAGRTGVDDKIGATSPYFFPGGGIMPEGSPDTPTRAQILEGVRKEALEELGYKLKKLKLLRKKGVRLDMPEWWVARNFRKRGVEYKGLDEYYVGAIKGQEDDSLYNSEGDAFPGRYYPIDQVAKALEDHANKEDNPFSEANRMQAELIRRLKTASENTEGSLSGLARYPLGGQAGFASGKKLKAKKDDHPTQRLKERTDLDPRIIEKLRAAIKANQEKIPDGHHHVTLDDGSRAVIKELRRRHVLATILASDMGRYPGQDLQYLNTKTAGARVYKGLARLGRKALDGTKNYVKNRNAGVMEVAPFNPKWMRRLDHKVDTGVRRMFGGAPKTRQSKDILRKGFTTKHLQPIDQSKNKFMQGLQRTGNYYGKNIAPVMNSRVGNLAIGGAGAYGTYKTQTDPNASTLSKGLALAGLAKGGGGLFSRGIASGTRAGGQHLYNTLKSGIGKNVGYYAGGSGSMVESGARFAGKHIGNAMFGQGVGAKAIRKGIGLGGATVAGIKATTAKNTGQPR